MEFKKEDRGEHTRYEVSISPLMFTVLMLGFALGMVLVFTR